MSGIRVSVAGASFAGRHWPIGCAGGVPVARAQPRGPGPDAEPSPDLEGEWFAELIDRAVNGPELPDYAGMPDSGASITSAATPWTTDSGGRPADPGGHHACR